MSFARRSSSTSTSPVAAILAASSTHQINMFGDLPGAASAPYYARGAMSLRRHTFTEVGGDFDPDIDASGGVMIFSSTRHHREPALYMKRTDGVAVTQLTSDPASDVQPAISPDGRRVAFASNRAGNWDIWVMALEGGPPVQVTNAESDDVHPSWSPDGSQLVYCSLPMGAGQWELWTADPSAGGTRRFIGFGLFPEWSPVGDTIVYQRAREQGSRWFSIWTMTFVDDEPRYPTEIASSASEAMILPSWSTDGTRITFATSASVPAPWQAGEAAPTSGVFDIWVINADGTGKVKLTDGHSGSFSPTFSPAGRVFFTSDRSGFDNIWSIASPPVQGGAVTGGGAKPTQGTPTPGSAQTASVKDGL